MVAAAGCAMQSERASTEAGTEHYERTVTWGEQAASSTQSDTAGIWGLLGEIGAIVGGGGLAGWGLTRLDRGKPTQKVGLPQSKIHDDSGD